MGYRGSRHGSLPKWKPVALKSWGRFRPAGRPRVVLLDQSLAVSPPTAHHCLPTLPTECVSGPPIPCISDIRYPIGLGNNCCRPPDSNKCWFVEGARPPPTAYWVSCGQERQRLVSLLMNAKDLKGRKRKIKFGGRMVATALDQAFGTSDLVC